MVTAESSEEVFATLNEVLAVYSDKFIAI